MPAAVTAPTASGAEAECPENRVKALDVLSWPCVRVRSPESPDRRWGNRPRYGGKAVGTVLARYYDPATAQFLTVDPDVDTTLSPYGYVAGDPLNDTDPSGDVGAEACVLAEIPIFGEIACGAGVVTEVITDVGAGAAVAGLAVRAASGIVSWGLPQRNVSYAKSAPQLSAGEQEAIANKEAGLPYDKALYNSGMQKLKTGQKYSGQRRSSQTAFTTGGCGGYQSA
jgi:RHS repeat-associated protein